MKTVRATGLLLVLLAVAGCRDECDATTFAPTCEGNVLVSCPTPGVDQVVPVRIRRTDCEAKFCVASPGICALSSSPEPLCADAGSGACDGNTLVRCNGGFATERAACLTCDAGVCEGGFGARCTGDSDCAPELTCADGGASRFCRSR